MDDFAFVLIEDDRVELHVELYDRPRDFSVAFIT